MGLTAFRLRERRLAERAQASPAPLAFTPEQHIAALRAETHRLREQVRELSGLLDEATSKPVNQASAQPAPAEPDLRHELGTALRVATQRKPRKRRG